MQVTRVRALSDGQQQHAGKRSAATASAALPVEHAVVATAAAHDFSAVSYYVTNPNTYSYTHTFTVFQKRIRQHYW